ncbi:MAG: carboxylate-amine ligase [Armatimonadetes bacterium]|nr:carboxylate-amine ligase [Armatimonadota bacterium]
MDGSRIEEPVVEQPAPTPDELVPEWAKLDLPPPGSEEEDRRFAELHAKLPALWRNLMADGHVEQTVVVVPSLSLDPEELQKLKGARHYEERLLFLLILLSLPKTRVIFITSEPIHPHIIDYYLQLLPGIPFSHARRRLKLFATYDASPHKSLTAKILERPSLLRRIRKALGRSRNTQLTVFNVTALEKRLSVALGIPLLGPDPRHLHYGSKSGARKLFREAGVALPDGFEDLENEEEILDAILELRARHPELSRVVIKINEGFSGEGNALFSLDCLKGIQDATEAREILARALPEKARYQAAGMNWEGFSRKFREMEGVVECFLEGDQKASPSVQMRITPLQEAQIISTHDQVLGGPDGQVFIGCSFPALPSYRPKLHEAGRRIGDKLAKAGVIGRLSIDFLTIPRGEDWDLYAIEINLRKGGTTHPFRTLQFLTGGRYNPETGLFQSGSANPKYYFASDNLESTKYRGLLPEDLIDIVTYTGLHYNTSTNTGVVFHMIGALSEYGKLGVTCVGDSPEHAKQLYEMAVETLENALGKTDWISS